MRLLLILSCALGLAGCVSKHGRCYGRAERDPETGLCECPPGTVGRDCFDDASMDDIDDDSDAGSAPDASASPDAASQRDAASTSDGAQDATCCVPLDASQDGGQQDAKVEDANVVMDAGVDAEADASDGSSADATKDASPPVDTSVAEACVAVAETCNGKDDDCDGVADNGSAKNECGGPCSQQVPKIGTTCNNGLKGVCAGNGKWVCSDAFTSGVYCDAPVVYPVVDTCNGKDDNCDGTVDEINELGTDHWGISCPGMEFQMVLSCTMPAIPTGCSATRLSSFIWYPDQ